MSPCNGSCSGGRAMAAARTRAGETGPIAERERPYCAASVSIAACRIKVKTRCTQEYQGPEKTALKQLRALPEWHIDQ